MVAGSSLPPSRDYYILGEGLLWIVEGLRRGVSYGSMYPYLIKIDDENSDGFRVLNGEEVLEVHRLYVDWWESLNSSSASVVHEPLRFSDYFWR